MASETADEGGVAVAGAWPASTGPRLALPTPGAVDLHLFLAEHARQLTARAAATAADMPPKPRKRAAAAGGGNASDATQLHRTPGRQEMPPKPGKPGLVQATPEPVGDPKSQTNPAVDEGVPPEHAVAEPELLQRRSSAEVREQLEAVQQKLVEQEAELEAERVKGARAEQSKGVAEKQQLAAEEALERTQLELKELSVAFELEKERERLQREHSKKLMREELKRTKETLSELETARRPAQDEMSELQAELDRQLGLARMANEEALEEEKRKRATAEAEYLEAEEKREHAQSELDRLEHTGWASVSAQEFCKLVATKYRDKLRTRDKNRAEGELRQNCNWIVHANDSKPHHRPNCSVCINPLIPNVGTKSYPRPPAGWTDSFYRQSYQWAPEQGPPPR